MLHLDPNRRAEALEAGWVAYRDRVDVSEEHYKSVCDNWDLVAVVDGDEVIGALFVRAGVIHLGIKPEWRGRWASRRIIRQMLAYGTKTTVQPWESGCLKFISRIGFRPVGDAFEMRG